ncbi:MAG: hypothetical protein IPG04_07005 [Polyangiaceae bacterium]|nr:hypothetical protein [Polyangiaceae bacterium]
MTQLDFVGVTHGNASYGQLIGGGNVIPVVSGKFGNGYVPAGKYSLDKPQATSEKSMVPPGKKSTHKYRLAAIGKPTKVINGKVHFWDERVGKWREGILIHYDGGTPGTLGCIGYIDPKHEGALKEMLADGGKVNVTYHDSVAAAQAHAKTLSGKDAPASDFANKYGGGGSGAKKKPSGKGKPSEDEEGRAGHEGRTFGPHRQGRPAGDAADGQGHRRQGEEGHEEEGLPRQEAPRVGPRHGPDHAGSARRGRAAPGLRGMMDAPRGSGCP